MNVLPSGDFVVTDPFFDDGPITDVGAVYLYSGSDLSLIATLTGSTSGGRIGQEGAGPVGPGVLVLPSGDYLVKSQGWDQPAPATTNVGAVTWCDGQTGCSGTINAGNSLVGSSANDAVGTVVSVLETGNYVVLSSVWDNPVGPVANVGAATFCSGTSGCTGPVSATNSLVGARVSDAVGIRVSPLTNGDYVVGSYFWDNTSPALRVNAGAATLCDGSVGCVGPVTNANSLVGTSANDEVGRVVTALSDGNYVVSAGLWNNLAPAITDAGAVTWCSGTTGCAGMEVSAANSLTGSGAGDQIGSALAPSVLADGAFAIRTQSFDDPWGGGANVGAVTYCGPGGAGCVGAVVSKTNSLVGGTPGDLNGPDLVPVANGNFVVALQQWTNPVTSAAGAGAVTFCDPVNHCAGEVPTIANSLIGASFLDNVGADVYPLANGNYVVASSAWNNGTVNDAGAATFCDGTVGCTGEVSTSNSFFGANADDSVGVGIAALTNENYVVTSQSWDSAGAANVGAATFCDGCAGSPSAANSLVGGTASDLVGNPGAVALTNDNYVVRSRRWTNPDTSTNAVGAATLCSGASGCVGLVSTSNSLIGSTALDTVADGEVTPLSDGNYVVESENWNNVANSAFDAGALTLGDGVLGTVGEVDPSNSVLGEVTNGISSFDYDASRGTLIVGRSASNAVSVATVPEPNGLLIGIAAAAVFASRRQRVGHETRG